jgi:hypothetical protein
MGFAARKERHTFTLDQELVGYLKLEAEQRSIASLSSALEEILRESKRQREREKIQSAISSYYDALPEAEREENRAWGAFAESQFPKD